MDRLIKEKSTQSLVQNSEIVKQKILSILAFFRLDHFDIPMITMYRKYVFLKDLQEEDVWSVFNLDLEYGKFMSEKQ